MSVESFYLVLHCTGKQKKRYDEILTNADISSK